MLLALRPLFDEAGVIPPIDDDGLSGGGPEPGRRSGGGTITRRGRGGGRAYEYLPHLEKPHRKAVEALQRDKTKSRVITVGEGESARQIPVLYRQPVSSMSGLLPPVAGMQAGVPLIDPMLYTEDEMLLLLIAMS